MVVATSGTVATYPFDQRKIIDHAFRRAGLLPQKVSAEDIEVAQDLIFTLTSEWINAGFPLWTREFLVLGITQGSPDVPCPIGTVDVFHTYWRILQPYRGAALTGGGGSANTLFSGQPGSDVTIAGPNPSVVVNFGSPTELDTIGVLLGGSTVITEALQVYTSPDNASWELSQTLPLATYTPGKWTYFDLDPSPTATYIKLTFPQSGTLALNQLNYGLANGVDTEIGPLNIDDYWNYPDKSQQGSQANSGYVDRQLNFPVIKIWPTPNVQAFYNGTITALVRRYIQDPGDMTNNVEVPQRWREAIIWRMASVLIWEVRDPEVTGITNPLLLSAYQQDRQARIQKIESQVIKSEALAWSEERTRAPIRWMPNLRPYTR